MSLAASLQQLSHASDYFFYSVASLEGGGPPRVTPSRGVTLEGKNLWANSQRIVDKRGRTGKKGDTPPLRGDTRVKAIKSDSDSDSDEQKKGRQVFQEKIEG